MNYNSDLLVFVDISVDGSMVFTYGEYLVCHFIVYDAGVWSAVVNDIDGDLVASIDSSGEDFCRYRCPGLLDALSMMGESHPS
jgi:hypothetical protein